VLLILMATAALAGCGLDMAAAGSSSSPGPGLTIGPSPSGRTAPTPTPIPTPAPTPVAIVHCPGQAGSVIGRSNSNQTTNWSGYAISAADRSSQVSCIEASWVEPVVTCASSGALTEVSIWVGIDGFAQSGRAGIGPEQVGTDIRCQDGVASQTAWWETYPSFNGEVIFTDPASDSQSDLAPMAIASGDRIWVQVAYADGQFTMMAADLTSGQAGMKTVPISDAPRLGAEWVVEAPALPCSYANCPVAPLAQFGPIMFDGALALFGGRLGSIGDDHWIRTSLIEAGDSPMAMTQVGNLTDGGQAFSIVWQHS
jgi:hypothetical protein